MLLPSVAAQAQPQQHRRHQLPDVAAADVVVERLRLLPRHQPQARPRVR